jgi:hypothetical protein
MREQTAATIHVGVNSSAVDSDSPAPSAIPLLSQGRRGTSPRARCPACRCAERRDTASGGSGVEWSGSPGTPGGRFGLACSALTAATVRNNAELTRPGRGWTGARTVSSRRLRKHGGRPSSVRWHGHRQCQRRMDGTEAAQLLDASSTGPSRCER